MNVTIAPENGSLGQSGAQQGTSPGVPDLDALLTGDSDPEAQSGSEPTKDPNAIQVEIDDRYKDLPESEAIARTMQSRYDRVYSDYEKLVARFEEVAPVLDIMDDLMENDEALYAFLQERKPELLQKKSDGSEIKTKLAQEFGEGYKPSLTREQADIEDPGGKDWRYYRRLDELYSETKQNTTYGKAETLKQYRARKEAERVASDEKLQKQVDAAKINLKMSDDEVQRISTWATGLTFEQITKIYRILTKFPTNRKIANVSTVTGSPTPISTARTQFLDTLRKR